LSIRNKRFTKAVNKILREELRKGNLPSSKEFIWKVNQYMQENQIDQPSLNFRPLRKQAVARSGEFNENIDRLYDDLHTLYTNAIEQHNTSLGHFNKFEVEKSKLDYQVKELENKLKELILLHSKSGFLNSVYDVFADMTKIDTSKTTANIDIGKHEVKLSDIKKTSKKINASATTGFEVSPHITPTPEIQQISGTVGDALSDKANVVWQTQILTKESQAVPTYFHVMFDKPQEMNRITLSLEAIKPTYIRIEATGDNINWFKLPYYEDGVMVEQSYTFDFPMLKVNRIRIMMAKDEPDSETLIKVGSTNEVRYAYLFGIKNLSFYTFDYAVESEFYTTVLDAEPDSKKNFTIDKVSLTVDEELPNGTDIKYYIALPPAAGKEPEWKDISPVSRENPRFDQLIDFKNISTAIPHSFSIDPTLSIGEYELENLYAHGIKFYKIGEVVDRKIITGTEKLFVGKNTWGVKSYEFQHADHTYHVPSIEDWRKPSNQVRVDYSKIVDGKPGLVLNKKTTSVATNYMFTMGVFSTKANEQVAAVPASFDPIAIYMNGELLFQGIPNPSNKITYLFSNGWNEIIVLVYTSKSMNTVNGATTDIAFDPRKYGSNVYAKAKALTMVPQFDLRYNVFNTDYDKYALVEVNNKTQVVLNHATPGLEYEFYYNYIDGTVKDMILLKAVFSRDDSITESSPKLKSYRLRFS
jgi:hypothetical protein